MRIGILTLPLHTNYGGILQAYALQTVLNGMGHEARVLDKAHHIPVSKGKMALLFPYRAYRKFILKKNEGVFREWARSRFFRTSAKFMEEFIERYLQRDEYVHLSDLKASDYDALIVGSDQVWRRMYWKHIEEAYLDFARDWNVIRMAYAASFGISEWDYTPMETQRCASLLSKFEAVGVREKDGVTLCKDHLQCNSAKVVLDPTMLLEADSYRQMILNEDAETFKGQLLSYVLDGSEEKKQILNQVASMLGLQIFKVNNENIETKGGYENNVQPPVEEWLNGFNKAGFVVTDSFHACVFSILFHKQFVVVGNPKRGLSRIYNLLETFELTDRLVLDTNSLKKVLNARIDYDKVDMILADQRKNSLDFLRHTLMSAH